MAKTNERKSKKPAVNKAEPSTSNVAVEPTPTNTPDLNAILERLEKVEQENAELKGSKKSEMFKKAKEINDESKKFSYKLW